MIIVRLKGGLGNQMFQYAFGRALAERKGSSLFLDLTFLQYRPSDANYTIRNYELGVFNIQEKFTFLSTLNQRISHPTFFYKLNYKLNSMNQRLKIIKLINEEDLDFNSDICDLGGNIYLDGYWQSERYFKDIENVIKKEFSFKSRPSRLNNEIIEKIQKTNSISLHIRRGDYVNNPKTLKKYGLLGLDYYKKALEIIGDKVTNPEFFVFSDDIEWVKSNFKMKNRVNYIDYNSLHNGHEDLRLMSHCKNHIIANSSFSWWGAWLSKSSDKIVIAPKNWFAKEEMERRRDFDIIPKNWIKL